jgi:hypothetical protein
MAANPAWLDYQERVGSFLASLGFTVRVGEKIRGARGQYEIDVVARHSKAGFSQLWVVECKLWTNPVPQAQVLTFAAIVDDVGADRGIFVSESGFQSGARSVVDRRNISLVTFQQLKDGAAAEIDAVRSAKFAHALEDLSERAHSIGAKNKMRGRTWLQPKNLTKGEGLMETCGRIAFLQEVVRTANRHGFPVHCYASLDDQKRLVSNWDELVTQTSELVASLERIVAEHERVNVPEIRRT